MIGRQAFVAFEALEWVLAVCRPAGCAPAIG